MAYGQWTFKVSSIQILPVKRYQHGIILRTPQLSKCISECDVVTVCHHLPSLVAAFDIRPINIQAKGRRQDTADSSKWYLWAFLALQQSGIRQKQQEAMCTQANYH